MKVTKRFLALLLSVMLVFSSAVPTFAATEKPVFPDIKGHWAEKVITDLYKDGVVAGFPDGTFKPNAKISRAEFSAMLARWLHLPKVEVEEPTFTDIGKHWATQQIEQLVANKVIMPQEYGSRYGVGMPLTRIEIMRLMIRALDLKMEVENSMVPTVYRDDASLSFRDRGIVNACTKYGIVKGYPDKTIGAYRVATRAEGAQMLKKMMKIYEDAYQIKIVIDDEVVKEFGLAQDDSYTLPSIPDKEDYYTLGWNTQPDGSGNMYQPGDKVSVSIDTTFYAIYDPIYKVAPSIKLSIPNTAKPGDKVDLEVAKDSVKTIEFVLKKDGHLVDIKDFVIGEVTEDGGKDIAFTSKGHFEFIYTVKNPLGEKEDNCVIQVGGKLLPGDDGIIGTPDDVWVDDIDPENPDEPIVKPVVTVELTAPRGLHVAEVGALGIKTKNISVGNLSWKVEKDGVQVVGNDWGKVDPVAGTIIFNDEGVYAITAYDKNSTNATSSSTVYIKVVPVSMLEISAPESTRLESEVGIDLTGENTDRLDIKYTLKKDGIEVPIEDYIEGDLPGQISFKEEGTYTITVTGTDEIDTEIKDSVTVIVYGKPSMGFTIPAMFHTDSTVEVSTDLNNMEDSVIWKLYRDGVEVPFAHFMAGALSDNGGSVQFGVAGTYTLAAVNADGEEYDSHEFTVLPVPSFSATITEKVRVGDDATITVDAENYVTTDTIEWYFTAKGEKLDSASLFTGTLDENGGTIQFNMAGSYILNAKITDVSGRVYTFEGLDGITVIPVLNIDFTMPTEATRMEKVSVVTSGNYGVTNVRWSVKEGTFSDIVNGELDNDGGSIAFKQEGTFTLVASITDELGHTYTAEHEILVKGKLPTVEEGEITITEPVNPDDPEDKPIINVGPEGSYFVEITVEKDGEPYEVSPTPEVGKPINVYEPGEYDITVKITDSEGGSKEETFHISIKNNAPVVDSLKADIDYTDIQGEFTAAYKVKVNLTATASDPDGDEVTLVWDRSGVYESGYLPVGDYTARVKARDKWGMESDWATIEFKVAEEVPTISLGSNSSTHAGKPIQIYVSGDKLDTLQTTFKLYKDGVEVPGGADDITINGGTLTLTEVGQYKVTVDALSKTGETSTAETTFEVQNRAPTLPRISVDVDYTNAEGAYTPDYKVPVNVNVTSSDPDGDSYTFEYDTGSIVAGKYGVGEYTIRVRAVDEWGMASDWAEKSVVVNGSTPNYLISAPSTTVRNNEVAVSGTMVNGSNLQVAWFVSKDGGDFTALTGMTSKGGNVQFTELGTYVVRAIATDLSGLTSTVDATIECVNQAPSVPSIAYAIDQTDILNEYTKEYAAKLNLYLDSTDPDGDEVTYEFAANSAKDGYYKVGNYVVKVRAVDKYGMTSDWAETTVRVSDIKSTVSLVAPATANRNDNIQLGVTGTNISTARYSWKVTKDGSAYTGSGLDKLADMVVNFAEPGNYTIEVTALNIFGNTATDTKTISVLNKAPNPPQITINIDYNDVTGAYTEAFSVMTTHTVSATDPEGDTITYEYATGSFDNGYATIGNHTIKVRAVDSYGAKSDWSSLTFEIKAEAPEFDISTVESIHAGSDFTVATSGTGVGTATVKWEIRRGTQVVEPDKGVLTNNGGTIAFNTVGTYTIKAVATDPSGKTSEATATVKVVNTNPVITKAEAVVNYDDVQNAYTPNFKAAVDFIVTASDPDNDAIEVDYDTAMATPGYYGIGSYAARVRVTDKFGGASSWVVVNFSVEGNQPDMLISAPTLTGMNQPVEVDITPVNAGTSKFSWTLKKDGILVEGLDESLITMNGGTLTFNQPGVYTLEATLTDISGQSKTSSVTIMAENQTPNAPTVELTVDKDDVTGEYTPDYKEKVNVSITGSDPDGDEVTFEIDDSSTIKESGYKAPGTYKIRVRATDPYGSSSVWVTKTVRIDVEPVDLALSYNGESHISEGVYVEAIGDGIEDAKIDWEYTDPAGETHSSLDSGTVLNVADADFGVYHVRVTATGRTGETATEEADINVYNNSPVLSRIESLVDLNDVQNAYTTDFKSKIAVNMSAYDPDGDEISVEYAEDSEIQGDDYYSEGTYRIKVRAKDQYGAVSDWMEDTVSISGSQPTISVGGPNSMHTGKPATLRASGTNLNDTRVTWTVTKPDGTSEVDETLGVTGGTTIGNQRGEWTYSIEVVNIYGHSATAEVKINWTNQAPVVDSFDLVVDYDDEVNAWTPEYGVKVTASVSGSDADLDNVTYEVAEGSLDVGECYKGEGTYTFKVRAFDGAEYSDWAEKTVMVEFNDEHMYYETNKIDISPNGSTSLTAMNAGYEYNKILSTNISGLDSERYEFIEGETESPEGLIYIGNISISGVGKVVISSDCITKLGDEYTISVEVEAKNNPPRLDTFHTYIYYNDDPSVNVYIKNPYTSKALIPVVINPLVTDPDGDAVEFEFASDSEIKGITSYLPEGEYSIKMRAKDVYGDYSEWISGKTIVSCNTPGLDITSPTLGSSTSTDELNIDFNVKVTGNIYMARIEYFDYYSSDKTVKRIEPMSWRGEPTKSITVNTTAGRHMYVFRVVTITGQCAYASKFFLSGGGGSSSGSITIDKNLGTATYEDTGIYDGDTPIAYVSSYKVKVPDIPDHNGNDYVFAAGFNPVTGQWEEIARVQSSNAGSLDSEGNWTADTSARSGQNDEYKLPRQKYTKIRLGYGMADLHESCLQNASTLDYEVGYEFRDDFHLDNLADLFDEI